MISALVGGVDAMEKIEMLDSLPQHPKRHLWSSMTKVVEPNCEMRSVGPEGLGQPGRLKPLDQLASFQET